VDQHLAQVTISSLADPQEFRPSAGRHLTGHKAKPGSKIPTMAKCLRIVDRRHESCCVQRTHTRDRHQKPACFVRAGISLELLIKRRDATIQIVPLTLHVLDEGPDSWADRSNICIHQHREASFQLSAASRHDDPTLQQDGPQLINERCSLCNKAITRAM
jgi:hypothetical protein